VILRLRAAFSALTSDRVRRVIIAGRRAGALSRVVGARAVLLAGVGEGAQRATAAATVAAQGQRRSSRSWAPPGSGQAPCDGEQPQAQRFGFGHPQRPG
jgi:hypothetical protein